MISSATIIPPEGTEPKMETETEAPRDQRQGRLRSKAMAKHTGRIYFLLLVAVLFFADFHVGPLLTANSYVIPNSSPWSQSRLKHVTISPTTCTSSPFSLKSTLEDNKSEGDSETTPVNTNANANVNAPRRTRRIDDILDEYDEVGDAGRTISILESSLKKEQQKSGTLAIKLAYAERVIAEQKKRLESKRSTLQKKTQALSETQKKLKQLEEKLDLGPSLAAAQNQNPLQSPLPLTARSQMQVPPPPKIRSSQSPQSQSATPWQQPPLTSKERQYPLITNWSINRSTGEVTGTVSCHPSIPDGTTIVTSGLNPESFGKTKNFVFEKDRPGTVVTTRSGSMYQLGVKKIKFAPQNPVIGPVTPVSFQPPQPQGEGQQLQLHPSNNLNPNLEYPLTGQSISNGRGTKYLLAGQPKRKPSGRSEIITAYKCDDQLKVCDTTPYIVKLSTQKEKLRREYENYREIQDQTVDKNKNNGWIGGISNMFDQQQPKKDPFVTCYDFLPVCEGSIKYAQHSAIVLEKGHEDLRDYEYRLQVQDDPEYPVPTTMSPSAVQASLKVAAKCMEVMHSRARLVWTDLKAENLIFMEAQDHESNTIVEIKGVDLESAVPHKGNPLDYTPEACPPEFARLHLQGNAYDFVLEYSYDVWSFGMLAYELATGRAYFRGKTPTEIMDILGDRSFVPPLGGGPGSASEAYDGSVSSDHPIVNKELRELIQACLVIDPRRRISVRGILGHPYFQQQSQSQQQQQSSYGAIGDQSSGGFGGGSGTFW